jgi:mono/diheme cytochrome c family protein
MVRNLLFTLFVTAMLVPATLTTGAAAEIPHAMEAFKSKVQPFFEANCIECHGPKKSKGKVTLHNLDGDLTAGDNLEQWETILDMLKSGEMPPEDEPQPSAEDRAAIIQWINNNLQNAMEKADQEAVPPVTRRLTNFEYQNTMRDLLGFELNLIENLAVDPVKPYHFNNTAEMMGMGPEQIDRYLEASRRAMASAIVDPGEPKVYRTEKTITTRAGVKGVEIGVYGGFGTYQATSLKEWPKTGEFKIRVKASAILPPGHTEVPLRLVMGTSLRHDAGTGLYAPVGTKYLRNDPSQPEMLEFRGRIENMPVEPSTENKKGPQPSQIYIYCQNLFNNGELNDHRKSAFDNSWELEVPRILFESIEFESPVTDVWPPEHHTRILFDSPLRQTDPAAYVREVLKRFMSRAYRRPVMPDELDRFVKIYNTLAGDFETLEAAMRETLAMVLISPEFLYHTVEKNGVATRHYELASKLSYFLWGSMPDEILINLAALGRLDDPKVIAEQVRRLLADQRSGDFVKNFTTQWLSLAKMKTVSINRDLFPRFLYWVHVGERNGQEVLFLPTIRDYMHDETVGFIAELIRRNASFTNLIDSDFAFLNQPLAAHYGISGVEGNTLRPVAIKPEDRLGGLLTQGSVLVGNGTGSAPHPIYRAVWLREAILGDEVKPPPADVPALSDSAGASAEHASSIKDLLRLHRTKESCNDCHFRLDPWGIPFEQYNAVGKYQPMAAKEGTRITAFNLAKHVDQAGYQEYLKSIYTVKIDADSRLPSGPQVDGMEDLKQYLLNNRKDEVITNVIRRLLSYSLGRSLTHHDRLSVDKLLKNQKMNGSGFQDIIISVCQSSAFRNLNTETQSP